MENSVYFKGDYFSDEKEYFISKYIRLPDCIIQAASLGKMDRFLDNLKYPFTDLKSRIGCYLFFDNYRFEGDVVDFSPLYVGKSRQLNIRLYRHWATSGNHIDIYADTILHDNDDYEVNLNDFDKSSLDKLVPSLDIKVAVWFENDLRELMFLEHELIYKFRPMFNKA
ncbi:hypothetical protein [Aliivibrio wodanis]|uniref:hypothetical protein n=1 Tax=Aliivibrio wodanis TaxID=80852 RepID=UPI00406D12BC